MTETQMKLRKLRKLLTLYQDLEDESQTFDISKELVRLCAVVGSTKAFLLEEMEDIIADLKHSE